MEIADSHIIITGAASGFGAAMTSHFCKNGAVVHAIDIDSKKLADINIDKGELYKYTCDISEPDLVEKTIEEIFEKDKEVNVLINNAGIMKNAPLVNLLERPDGRHSIELWNQVIDVNLNAVFYMTRAVVNKMLKKRNKGVVINISSIAAKGNAGQTAYSASKAAVESMTKVWAKEFGAFGIRSAAIAPGFMNTLGTHDALEEKMLKKWISQTPLKRTGEIEEVISTAEFIMKNEFVNGEVININGGLSI